MPSIGDDVRKALGVVGALSLLALPLALAAPASVEAASSGVAGPGAGVTSSSPIRHVVIVYQENHSFDDVLGAVCRRRSTSCNGYTGPVTFADGAHADNIVQPDRIPQVAHNPAAQLLAMSGQGDQMSGCQRPPYYCVSHVPPGRIPNLAALARTFAVSDATFASNPSASFGEHVALAAGTILGFTGTVPVDSVKGVTPGPGWGCPSRRDVLWARPGGQPRYVPSCVPNRLGNGPYRPSPVPYAATIMQRIEAAGLSWHIYQGHSRTKPFDGIWSVCPYFFWCAKHRFDLGHDSSVRDFLTAARTGRLPALSLLMPMPRVSQHNGFSMAIGDNYIGHVVGAVERSPQWRSTAIFITYDDCGCFYDHVQPPPGLGIRNPMVIVSPWVRPTFTDSTTAVQPYSMLAFVEHNFGLARLSPQVRGAYDYGNAFDFTQPPLPGIPMTHSRVPPSELARIARTPQAEIGGT